MTNSTKQCRVRADTSFDVLWLVRDADGLHWSLTKEDGSLFDVAEARFLADEGEKANDPRACDGWHGRKPSWVFEVVPA